MEDSTQQRLHAATPRRRQQAREAGHVASSRDLSALGVLLAGVAGLVLFGGTLGRGFADIMSRQLSSTTLLTTTDDSLVDRWQATVFEVAQLLLPLLVAMLLLPIAVHLVQTGFLFRPSNLVPDFQRISPAKGFGRILSARHFAQTGLSVLKIAVVGAIACGSVAWSTQRVVGMVQLEVPELAVEITSTVIQFILIMTGALLVLALVDYAYQRWKYEQDLKMTTQELRDELRETEGDPQLAARRRAAMGKITAVNRDRTRAG